MATRLESIIRGLKAVVVTTLTGATLTTTIPAVSYAQSASYDLQLMFGHAERPPQSVEDAITHNPFIRHHWVEPIISGRVGVRYTPSHTSSITTTRLIAPGDVDTQTIFFETNGYGPVLDLDVAWNDGILPGLRLDFDMNTSRGNPTILHRGKRTIVNSFGEEKARFEDEQQVRGKSTTFDVTAEMVLYSTIFGRTLIDYVVPGGTVEVSAVYDRADRNLQRNSLSDIHLLRQNYQLAADVGYVYADWRSWCSFEVNLHTKVGVNTVTESDQEGRHNYARGIMYDVGGSLGIHLLGKFYWEVLHIEYESYPARGNGRTITQKTNGGGTSFCYYPTRTLNSNSVVCIDFAGRTETTHIRIPATETSVRRVERTPTFTLSVGGNLYSL